MFTLHINAKNIMHFPKMYSFDLTKNHFSRDTSIVFVTFIFAIFKDRAFTNFFIDLEDVYILNYKLHYDWLLYPTM